MSDKNKEKTEVELSWESGKFEEDLKGLDKQITKEIWAHDKLQYNLQSEDFTWKGALTGISVFFGIMVAISKAYFPSATDVFAEVSLMALIPALMGFYTWRDPAGKRATHILVSGQKADTQSKINLQLIQKPKHRELATTFYAWIHEEFGRVGGTGGAYLSGNLLAQYPEPEDYSSSEEEKPLIDHPSKPKKE